MLYRKFTQRCIYCGNKKKRHFDGRDSYFYCLSDLVYTKMALWGNPALYNGCSKKKKFIKHKEAKVQKALGLLSRPKGI